MKVAEVHLERLYRTRLYYEADAFLIDNYIYRRRCDGKWRTVAINHVKGGNNCKPYLQFEGGQKSQIELAAAKVGTYIQRIGKIIQTGNN